MDPRTIARVVAIGRVVIGAALLAAPERLASGWLGSAAQRRPTQLAVMSLGARDIAIGLGTAWAVGGLGPARPWLLSSAAVDLADFVATVKYRDSLSTTAVVGVGALAGGSAALGAWLAAEIR